MILISVGRSVALKTVIDPLLLLSEYLFFSSSMTAALSTFCPRYWRSAGLLDDTRILISSAKVYGVPPLFFITCIVDAMSTPNKDPLHYPVVYHVQLYASYFHRKHCHLLLLLLSIYQ